MSDPSINELMQMNTRLAQENKKLYHDLGELAAEHQWTRSSASFEAETLAHTIQELKEELQKVRDEDAKVAAELAAENHSLKAKIQALEAAKKTAEERVKLLEVNDDCLFNRELGGLDGRIMQLEQERNAALDLAAALQDQFAALPNQEGEIECLLRTGNMAPSLVRTGRSLFNAAKDTGDRKALCEWLKQKKNTILLDVFEDICNEFELIGPVKGSKRTTKKEYLALLKEIP
jgi:uncharacterized protein involved in exopolysaccharide biosynthesis